jgi:hypothetical protein
MDNVRDWSRALSIDDTSGIQHMRIEVMIFKSLAVGKGDLCDRSDIAVLGISFKKHAAVTC